MKHERNGHLDHQSRSIRGWTRKQWRELYDAPWRQLKAVEGDNIAFREYILRHEGMGTLWNIIKGDHHDQNQ